jgi:hypothetical protein
LKDFVLSFSTALSIVSDHLLQSPNPGLEDGLKLIKGDTVKQIVSAWATSSESTKLRFCNAVVTHPTNQKLDGLRSGE